MKTALTALALSLAISTTCWASQITQDQVAALKIGSTTYEEALNKLGKPTTVETSSDGKTISYTATRTQVKAATYVPIVGLFAGGAKGLAHTVKLEFGADGILKKTSTTDTEINCRAFGGCK